MNNLFHSFEYTSLVTILAIVITMFFMFRVGFAREKYNVSSPKMEGNEAWEILCRIHLNTVEQIVLFLPALWLAAFYSSDKWAAGIGTVWLVGRLLYSYLFISTPKKRGPGMMLTFLPTAVLAGIALFQIVRGMM